MKEECKNTNKENTKNRDIDNERKDKRVGKMLIIFSLTLIFLFYSIGSHLVIQIALVPSFMEKLRAFQDFTEKGYAEQVYTEDIVASMNENYNAMMEWIRQSEPESGILMSDDGIKLVGTRFVHKDTESHTWVLMLHGYTGWKEEMYKSGRYFYEAGYNVLCVDMRAHGQSEGDMIGMGYLDRLDNLRWLQAIQSWDSEAQFVLYGQSMGGAAVIHLAKELNIHEDLKRSVLCCIADSAFCSPIELFQENVKDWTGLPTFGLLETASLLLKLEGGYTLKEAAAIKAVEEITIPTLFIHGLSDGIVDPSNSKRLYDACNAETDLLWVEGAGHTQSYEKDSKNYFNAVFGFIDKYKES